MFRVLYVKSMHIHTYCSLIANYIKYKYCKFKLSIERSHYKFHVKILEILAKIWVSGYLICVWKNESAEFISGVAVYLYMELPEHFISVQENEAHSFLLTWCYCCKRMRMGVASSLVGNRSFLATILLYSFHCSLLWFLYSIRASPQCLTIVTRLIAIAKLCITCHQLKFHEIF